MRLETPGRIGMLTRASALRDQLAAEAVALGAEGEQRARRQLGGLERIAPGIDREQRPVELVELLQPLQAGDRHGVVQPGGAAQRVRMPGIVAAGAEHAGDVGGGGDAHAGAHVAEIAGVLEQHDRRGPPVGQHRGGIDRRALGQRHHPRRRRQRSEPVEDRRVDLAGEGAQARAQTRARASAARRSSSAASLVSTSITFAPKRSACLSG